MGMFAGAVFIRNEENKSKETVIAELQKYMDSKGYAVSDAENAKVKYCFSFPEGKWFAFTFREEELRGQGSFLAKAFQSDAVSADLCDSDFVELELFQPDGKSIDHEIIGTPYWDEPMYDEDISKWFKFLKEGVSQEELETAVNESSVFAEDAFSNFAKLLDMKASPLWVDIDNPEEDSAEMLYFKKK